MLKSGFIVGVLLLGACVTPSRSYDSERPGEAWDASCTSKNIERFPSWVIVNCAFSNRSQQDLVLPSNLDVTAKDQLWRKPQPEELEQLQKDLRAQQKAQTSAPIFIGGGQNVEMFFAQLAITSGLWMAQSLRSEPSEKLAPASSVKVPAGTSLERIFALFKEKAGHPEVLNFRDPNGLFEKAAPLTRDIGAARQRQSSEILIPE